MPLLAHGVIMLVCQHYRIPVFVRAPVPKFPLRTMKVGESFHVPPGSIRSIRCTVNSISKRLGKKFSMGKDAHGNATCTRMA